MCTTGSQDKFFTYRAALWILGSTPANLKAVYGQSIFGYMPNGHSASIATSDYSQRPVLQEISDI